MMATKKSEAMEELLAAFGKTPTYTAKTEEQLRQQAATEKQSYYDQLRLSTQQAHARNDLALQQQREGLQATYDKQREASAEQYRKAYSQADREILRRGMQRSSYGVQTLANVNQAGAKAQQQLYDQQGAAEGNIDAQRALLAQQLGDQLRQYDANQLADAQARYDELAEREYGRQQDAADRQNALAQQIYQLTFQEQQAAQNQANWEAQMQYQKEADTQAQANWQAEFDESVRQFNAGRSGSGGSSGRGSGNGSNVGSVPVPNETPASGTSMTYDDFMSSLSSNSGVNAMTRQEFQQRLGTADYLLQALRGNVTTNTSTQQKQPSLAAGNGPVNPNFAATAQQQTGASTLPGRAFPSSATLASQMQKSKKKK